VVVGEEHEHVVEEHQLPRLEQPSRPPGVPPESQLVYPAGAEAAAFPWLPEQPAPPAAVEAKAGLRHRPAPERAGLPFGRRGREPAGEGGRVRAGGPCGHRAVHALQHADQPTPRRGQRRAVGVRGWGVLEQLPEK
jgi:hypothetical protein